MQKTCGKCGCQVYDPFGGFIKMHDEEKCCGVVRTGFAITEPVPDINDSTVTCTETNGFNSISLPKEVEKLKEIVDDINKEEPKYIITTT